MALKNYLSMKAVAICTEGHENRPAGYLHGIHCRYTVHIISLLIFMATM